MTVSVEDSDFQPDATSKRPDPLVLVQVLFPDSGTGDRATKLRADFELPSVRHDLIVWPEQPRIVQHARMPIGELATELVTSGTISLDPLGISVTVEEFYLD